MKLPARRWKRVLLFLGILFVLMQAVPYGRAHDNPPVTREPAWDSPRTAELAKLLGLPILLIIDGTKTTRTMAAVVSGPRFSKFSSHDPMTTSRMPNRPAA